MPCCPTCGQVVEREANFCSRCGRAIRGLPTGDRRVVTVLFADVSGFTRMSETLDPERVAEIVNSCFKALSEPVYRFGGVVDKYIGDAIMALFGAPVAHGDDPERAVSAAYAMQRAAERFTARLEAEAGIRLRIRIGLNTGLVVAGAIGGDQRRDYTVMGDAVNLAQRLESQAEPGSILVSGETYRLTRHAFSYQSARKLFVKGREEAVYAYELKGPRLEPPLPSERAPLVARHHELARLRSALAEAASGQPQWITVTGPAGCGKSRLVREALGLLPDDPRRLVLEARGHAYHADSAFSVPRQLVEGLMASESPDDPLASLEAGLAEHGLPDPERLASELASLLGLEGTGVPRALDALFRLLTEADRPMIVLVEDLHRIDDDSLRWLSRIGASLEATSLSLVTESRDPARLPGPEGLIPHRLELGPLTPDESWQLALAELSTSPEALEPGAWKLLQEAVERSDGNPLFLREVIQAWLETGCLKRAAGRWKADRRPGEALPSSINAILVARLDQLPGELRAWIEVASALGERIAPDLLGRLMAASDPSERLAELQRRGFLQPRRDGAWGFAQALMQEVTYETILLSRRRDLHQRIAIALEAEGAPVETLARHYRLAGDARRAIPCLHAAARRARKRAAHSDVCLGLRQALALYPAGGQEGLLPRVDLLRELAESEAVLGQHEVALATAREARELVSEPRDVALVERTLGLLHERMGDYAQATLHLGTAARLSPDEALHDRCRLDLAWIALRQGDQSACLAACGQVLRSPRADGEARAMAHSLCGVALDRLGQWQSAAASHREALTLRIKGRDRFGVASSLNNLGMALTELGSWREAERHYRRSLRLYERIGDLARASAVLNNLGDLAARRGDLDEAEARHRKALEARDRLGDRFGMGASRCALGWVLALKGDLDEGGRLIREGVAQLEAIGERELLAEAYQVLGRIALESRRYPEAEVQLERALGLSQFDRNPLQRAIVHRLRSQVRLEWGDLGAARLEIDEAMRVLGELEHPLERARARVILSRLLRAEGRFAEADQVLGEAVTAFERLGARLDLMGLAPEGSPEILCADPPKPHAR